MNLLILGCSVCFQVEHNATTDGLRAAVLVLVAVTVCVLIGFGMFIRRLVRSARPENRTPELQIPGTPEPQNPGTPQPWTLPTRS